MLINALSLYILFTTNNRQRLKKKKKLFIYLFAMVFFYEV